MSPRWLNIAAFSLVPLMTACYIGDEDRDGYAAEEDCDDGNAARFPGATEVCNGADDDCDGSVDEGTGAMFYVDGDGDGVGDDQLTTVHACEVPDGYAAEAGDCDDGQGANFPGNVEVCDGIDNDCDESIDDDDGDLDASTGTPFYADVDQDGYGDPDAVSQVCVLPEGYAENAEDCDDGDPEQHPDALEYCNGEDDDCDGALDEDDATDAETWYADTDGDGYGDAASTTTACELPSGYAANDEDCDPDDGAQFPGADEYCNGEDDDCRGDVDEDDAVDAATWYADSDADGYGDASASAPSCAQPEGSVADDSDCDDDDRHQYPGADEYCNDEDDDCDGDTDEDDAVDPTTWYEDADSDGYGDPDNTTQTCELPSGYASSDDDCDPADGDQYPGADEYCNDEDDDCDGDTDEDDAVDATTWYADADSDGYGDPDDSSTSCDQPGGTVEDDQDCDDDDDDVNPDGDEICDGVDNDCDSGVTEDDMASTVDATGAYTDVTSSVTGTSSSPASYAPTEDLVFCDGTFYVLLDLTSDIDVSSYDGDPTTTVLDGAGAGSVVRLTTDGVAASLSGLTLQNGQADASVYWDTSTQTGGGIQCEGSTGVELELDAVIVESNDAGSYGGGLFAYECDVTITDSEFSSNTAGGGAGIYASEAVLDLDDVVVDSNTATGSGGGVVLDGAEDFTWSGSSTGISALTSNTDGGEEGGLFVADDVFVTIANVDFGTSGGGDDNSLYDITTEDGAAYMAEDGASFRCTGGTCGTSVSSTIGASSSGYSYSGVIGTVISATTNGTLDSAKIATNDYSSGCGSDMFLVTNNAATGGNWTVLWSVEDTTSTSQISIQIPVESGNYYGLVSSHNGCTAYFSAGTASNKTVTGLGVQVGYLYKAGNPSGTAVGSTINLNYGSYSGFDIKTTVAATEL